MPQLLPNGKQSFFFPNGSPLANGTVGFYLPNTLTPATTWADSGGVTPNPNPVTLDANGQAVIYGTGVYRQIVKDVNGVTIWDQNTTSPAGSTDLSASGTTPGAGLVGFDGGFLTDFFKSKNNRVVDSIALLRGLSKTVYTRAFVTGYYAAGDGGGGAYYYDSTDTTSADNGGTIIVASDGGRWKLQLTTSVSVKQFGAKGDGVSDDTVAINNALASRTPGGRVFMPTPASTYLVSGPLNMAIQGVTLEGEDQYSTLITCSNASSKIINSTANFNVVKKLAFIYSGTPISGATAIYSSGANFQATEFIVRNGYNTVEITSGSAQFLSQFQIFNYVNIGLFVHAVNDVFVSQFILNAGNTTNGALGGIRLQDFCEAFNASDGDVLLGVYPMTTDATTYSIGTRPAYNRFQGVYFDSAASSVQINNSVEFMFVNCWFSAGRSGTGSPGCALNTCDSIVFTNTHFFNCGSHGCLMSNSARRVVWNSCVFDSNSVTAGNGVANGLTISANTTDFIVKGCIAGNWNFSGKQGYGISVQSGTSDGYTICDNDVSNNFTGGISDLGTGLSKYVARNIGYRTQNSGTGTVANGTSSIVVNHGLAITPQAQDISFARTGGPTGEGAFYLDTTSITSTSFTLRTNVNVTSSLPFVWQVRSAGA